MVSRSGAEEPHLHQLVLKRRTVQTNGPMERGGEGNEGEGHTIVYYVSLFFAVLYYFVIPSFLLRTGPHDEVICGRPTEAEVLR